MGSSTPTFSIIIPTYRRRRALDACLHGLAELRWSHDLVEVLVVDDGGGMPLDDILARHDRDLNLRCLRQRRAGPASARNAAARDARGRYLLFLDEDSRPSANYLREVSRALERHGGRGVGGHTENALPARLLPSANQCLVECLYDRFNTTPGDARFLASNNLVVPRDPFLALGGFDETLAIDTAQERDFCDRWREAGHELVYVESAVVYRAHDVGVVAFIAQHYDRGRGAFVHGARSRRGDQDPGLANRRLLLELVRYPLAKERGLRGVLLAGLAALSLFPYGAGYFLERVRNRHLLRSATAPGRFRPVTGETPAAAATPRTPPASTVGARRTPLPQSLNATSGSRRGTSGSARR